MRPIALHGHTRAVTRVKYNRCASISHFFLSLCGVACGAGLHCSLCARFCVWNTLVPFPFFLEMGICSLALPKITLRRFGMPRQGKGLGLMKVITGRSGTLTSTSPPPWWRRYALRHLLFVTGTREPTAQVKNAVQNMRKCASYDEAFSSATCFGSGTQRLVFVV